MKNTSLLELKKSMSPEGYASFLREQGRIYYWDAAKFYVVSDFKLAQEILKNPAFSADRSSFFISRMPNINLELIKDFFGIVQKMMVMSDGKSHESRRNAAAQGIDGDLLDHYREIIKQTIRHLVQNAKKKTEFDFATDIAEPLPGLVLADLFCIETKDREAFYNASIQMTRFFGGAAEYNNEEGRKVNEAAIYIREFFRNLLEDRKKKPRDDFFSILLKSPLSEEEIIAQSVMMLVAGQVTTTDQLNNNFFQMIPLFSKLKQDPSLIPAATEEFNRLDPGVTYLFRTVKQNIEIGGIQLKPEDVVFISNHAVNRDPEVFPNPNQVDLYRKKNPHFAFGFGPHFCLGARLARMQMNLCFEEIIKTFSSLEFSGEPVRNHYALSFSGFLSIPIMENTKEKK